MDRLISVVRSHGKASVVAVFVLAGTVLGAVTGLQAGIGQESGPLPASELAAILADEPSSPLQQAALADGTVTPQEYTDATNRTQACLEEAGVKVEQEPGPGGTIGLRMFYPADRPAGDVDTDIEGCLQEHRGSLGRVWAAQSLPSEEEVEELSGTIRRCLESAGFSDVPSIVYADVVEEHGPDSEVARALEDCVLEISGG